MDGEEEYRGKDRDTLLDHARQILSGGVAYFNSTIMGKLSSDIEIFKMCRFANPIAMRQRVQAPECIMEFKAALESLRRFPTETVNNIVGAMSGITGPKRDLIINRQLCHWFRASIDLGTRVAAGLGVDINAAQEHMTMAS